MRLNRHRVTTLAIAICALTPGLAPGAKHESPEREHAEPASQRLSISEPGFEADGTWRFAGDGAKVNGFFGSPHSQYIEAGLIDVLPEKGRYYTYNNGKEHDLYQVLTATVAADTTYKLSILAIDTTFTNPFPGGKLRLGYVLGEDDGTTGDRIANHDYGEHLLLSIAEACPLPANGPAPDDGYATWTVTFTTGPEPAGLSRPLRIEVLGGGRPQSLFDNVQLSARPASAKEKRERLQAESQEPDRSSVIVMFGDSTTERGMPNAVKGELNKLVVSPQSRPTVINAGKGGDNATSALSRLKRDVLDRDPDIVTLSFGLNDTGSRQPKQFKQSLEQMTRTLESAGIKILLMTSTPFNNKRHGWAKDFEAEGGLDEYMNKAFCGAMRAVAREKQIPLCDLHAVFMGEFKKDPAAIDTLISGDGVHLTAEGYSLIARHVAPMLLQPFAGNESPGCTGMPVPTP